MELQKYRLPKKWLGSHHYGYRSGYIEALSRTLCKGQAIAKVKSQAGAVFSKHLRPGKSVKITKK